MKWMGNREKKLYKVRNSMNLNDKTEEKFFASASVDEIVELFKFYISKDEEVGKEQHGSILPKLISKNVAFLEPQVLEILYSYGFLELWYRMGDLSNSKMLGFAVKKDHVEALKYFAEHDFFAKTSIVDTCIKNAEKYGSNQAHAWLKEYKEQKFA